MNGMRPITKIRQELQQLLEGTLEGPEAAFALAEEVEHHPEGLQAVSFLLVLLERNQHIEWGTPGTLVHSVEAFFKRGYESLLLESVSRTPTCHTLWMVNRIINGLPKGQQRQYLSALRAASIRNDVSQEVREQAISYLEFQEGR